MDLAAQITGDDRATRIAVGPCETVLVAGSSNGDLLHQGPTLGDFDAFVLRATDTAR